LVDIRRISRQGRKYKGPSSHEKPRPREHPLFLEETPKRLKRELFYEKELTREEFEDILFLGHENHGGIVKRAIISREKGGNGIFLRKKR